MGYKFIAMCNFAFRAWNWYASAKECYFVLCEMTNGNLIDQLYHKCKGDRCSLPIAQQN